MTLFTRRGIAAASLLSMPLLMLRSQLADARPADAPAPAAGIAGAALRDTAVEAYIYGYPLITMEMTRESAPTS